MSNPRIPDELHALRGTPVRDPPSTVSPQLPRLDEPPEPPRWLTDLEARNEWRRCAAVLAASGLLHEGTLALLAHYTKLHVALLDKYRRGEHVRASYYSALRALAAALGLIQPTSQRGSGDAVKRVNPFARFKKPPEP